MTSGKLPIAISAAFAVFTALGNAALAQPAEGYFHGSHMWEGGSHGWFMAPFMMIVFLIFVVVIAFLIIRWFGGGHRGGNRAGGSKLPHDILDERFARGEIDSTEYRERKSVLRE